MMGKSVWIWIGFALAGAAAQTNTFPVTGNVGIGTTSPGYPLQVNGSGDMQMGISSSDANAHVWTLQSSGSGSLVGTFQIIDRTVGASRLLVDTSGNVGIGTTSPQSNLQISTYGPYLFPGGGGLATTYASSGIGFNLYRGSDNNWHTMSDGANGGGYAFLGNTNGQLFLLQVPSAGNVSQSLADSSVWPGKIALSVLSGNVGIGTTNPQYPLSVNGTIQAKEVLVNTGWSDYVFDPHYRIKPLPQLAAYIKANHHLPDIPTEAEVEKNGVSLGDMQAKLLAKIEELTLQMIQLDKKNKALEKRMAQIEGR